MHDAYRQHETAFAATMADRTEWERATRHQRQLAVAADAELRRRHPDQPWPPLRSAEPRLSRPGRRSRPWHRTPRRQGSGSGTWPPGTANSPASWPNGKA